jgi:2-polyprenyl-6-hydroxyphenyl methylase/3-demethylubiquinone-9 3-methyltransferase
MTNGAPDAATKRRAKRQTVAAQEVARFAAIADAWWDPNGEFRSLHRLNPVRVAYVRDRLAAHFGREAEAERPLAGISVLDIGCGGGLVAEAVTGLGAAVTGIDAESSSIGIAATHARAGGLHIDYRCAAPEDLVSEGRSFPAVIGMEVIEHVADPDAFVAAAATLLRPGGALVVATLNRTLKSLVLAKIGAEYVLRWLPPGTHDWNRFVRPSELAALLRRHRLQLLDLTGITYHPLTDQWSLADDLAVNYLGYAVKR